MIKRLENFECLSGVNSPLLPIICCSFRFSLGELDGAYIQRDNSDKISCVFSLEGNSINFSLSDGVVDYSELTAFFELAGVKYITSDVPLEMAFKSRKTYDLLVHNGNDMLIDESCIFLTQQSSVEDYKTVHSVALSDICEFSEWYALFSRKLNNGFSSACFIYDGKRAVSAACVPFIYKHSAVISGVETLYDERGKGYGSRLISSVVMHLSERSVTNVFLWCKKDKLSFYKRLGFRELGKIYVGEC